MECSTLDIIECHDTESHQMQLFVQSEAESRNFGEVSRVLHLAVRWTDTYQLIPSDGMEAACYPTANCEMIEQLSSHSSSAICLFC